jgi:hypothetical protein
MIAGANAQGGAGIDSVQDMAGVLAGLQSGQAYIDLSYPKKWSSDVMGGAMGDLRSYLYEGLSERFEGDTQTYLDQVNKAGLMASMGSEYIDCPLATEQLPAGQNHSSFSGFPNLYRDRRKLIETGKSYWKVYSGVKSDWVDISGLPNF